jgi:hypothetical protein
VAITRTAAGLREVLDPLLDNLKEYSGQMDINSMVYHDTAFHISSVTMASALVDDARPHTINAAMRVYQNAIKWYRALDWSKQ